MIEYVLCYTPAFILGMYAGMFLYYLVDNYVSVN